MFEATQEEDKQSSKRGLIVAISIVVVLAIVGTIAYLVSKGDIGSSSASSGSTATSASVGTPAPAGAADATKDLHILSTKMDKDYTGTTAVWLVDVRNASQTYTYSHIKYQTTYGGATNNVIGQNTGEIPKLSLGPGEEQTVQFNDAAYPAGTAWYRVTITGASATQ